MSDHNRWDVHFSRGDWGLLSDGRDMDRQGAMARGLMWDATPHVTTGPDQKLLSIAAEAGDEAEVRLLLKMSGVDPDSKSRDGRTALSYAAENGHSAVVELLLVNPEVDPDSKSTQGSTRGRTPLSYAASEGRMEVVKLLLKTGRVVVDSGSGSGWTPLLHAAREGHVKMVQLLLDHGADPSSANAQGKYPISYAAAMGRKAVVELLLTRSGHGADSIDKEGMTPLSLAARNGHQEIVSLLLAVNGVLPDTKDTAEFGQGRTPLSYAAEEGHEAVVKLLLSVNGVDPDSKGMNGQTPLSWAAESGRVAVVESLMATGRVDLNSSRCAYKRTPLAWAADRGHTAVMKLLLSKEATSLNPKDHLGQTPLSLAAEKGHEAVVELLLEKGADLNSRCSLNGRTPLSGAAWRGHETIVERLLASDGIEKESKDWDGQTALSLAAKNGRVRVVSLLLAADVNPDSEDRKGQTPLLRAAKGGHYGVAELLVKTGRVNLNPTDRDGQTIWAMRYSPEHKAVIQLLLENGANPSPSDSTDLLRLAVEQEYEAVVRLLLTRGEADPNSKDTEGRTPLSWAAQYGGISMVELLLAQDGVDPNTTDQDGRTPLSWQAERGRAEAVSLLLATNKVDIDVKDSCGRTPLSFAQEKGHKAVVKLLLEAGADPNSVDSEEGNQQPQAAEKIASPETQLPGVKGTKARIDSTPRGEGDSHLLSRAPNPLGQTPSNLPATTPTLPLPSPDPATTSGSQSSFEDWDSLAPLSVRIDQETIRDVLSSNQSAPRKALLDWIFFLETPGASGKLAEHLSARQATSLRVLQEWWKGSFQPKPLSMAARRYVLHLASSGTEATATRDVDCASHEAYLQDSFYHKACCDLFMAELCPPVGKDDDVVTRLRFVVDLERLRDVATEQTKAQRVAYETFVYLESGFSKLNPEDVRMRNIYEGPPMDNFHLVERLERFRQASYDMRWYWADKKSKGLEPGSTSSWTKLVDPARNASGRATQRHHAPRYLWDIQKRCTVTMAGSCPPYTCISHTWGRWRSKSPSVAIPGVKWKVPQNTIYDVRELPNILAKQQWDTEYLWFDLLTIPQEDRSKTTPLSQEEEELKKIADEEITRQADIFQGSTVCIAWLNHIPGDLSSLQCAVDWLCLQHLRLSSRDSRHTRDAFFNKQQDWLLHKPVTDLEDFISKALLEVGGLELLDPESREPTPWFSSLWTLQELHLCPDMILVTRDWKPLWNPTGTATTVGEMLALLNSVVQNDGSSAANGAVSFGNPSAVRRSGPRISKRATDCGELGKGAKGMTAGWPTQVTQLLEFFQRAKLRNASSQDRAGIVGILLEANTRQVSAQRLVARAQAIMSAIGCTVWYEKKDEVIKQGLVLGAYPLPFVQEVVQKVGAAFFLTISSVRVDWWEQKSPIGTMLPFAPPNSTRVRNDYNLQPIPSFSRDHPSLSTWEIQIDGAVKISKAAVLASKFEPDGDEAAIVVDVTRSRDDEDRGVIKNVFLRMYVKGAKFQFAVVLAESPVGRVGLLLSQVGDDEVTDPHAHLKLYKSALFAQSYDQAGFNTAPVLTDVDWLVI